MRRTAPLILGAGPAGCAAAIVLAEEGRPPIVLDRDAEVHDQLCGGFLSWRTAEQLRALGVDPAGMGASFVDRVTLFGAGREVEVRLPSPAFALSRRALDGALRERAIAAGARLEIGTARSLEGTEVVGRNRRWSGDGLFVATGKHDLRGMGRPRPARDPTLGMRLRLSAAPEQSELLTGRIELHLFDGGYAGIVLHEDGTANVCLAMRKSRLARAGRNPARLLADLADKHPRFARRLMRTWNEEPIESIGAIPYGWIARAREPGVFRLGDQAAVIPSLAGEGISIALASGIQAARSWLALGACGAVAYQRRMAEQVASPLRAAGLGWSLAESPSGARTGLAIARRFPAALGWLIRASRIEPDARLAPRSGAP